VAFTVTIFIERVFSDRVCADIVCEFHQNCLINVESVVVNPFTSRSKIWLSWSRLFEKLALARQIFN